MTESTTHPAALANMRSIEYASTGNKASWLDLYDDDALVADPVGISPFDASGQGHRGKAAIEAFWDMVIGPANLTMTVHQRCPSGTHSCGVSMTAVNDLGNGVTTRIDMIAVYEVNDSGKIRSMRAYWSWDELTAQLADLGLG